MQRTWIHALYQDKPENTIEAITVNGWVRSIRDSKAFAFVTLHDGSDFRPLQVVLDAATLPNYSEIVKQNVGASLSVTGTLVPTPDAQQPFELKATSASVVGASTPDYPLQKKQHSVEFLRTIAHLRPRTNLFMAVFRVRSLAAQIIHDYFHQNGFVYVHTPIITTSDAEGAGEMFRVTTLDAENPPKTGEGVTDYAEDFFGRMVGLSVSGQLNVEGFCLAMDKVYTFGPTFRAERSFTARHAAEFWMIEPEIAFATLKEDMDLAESLVKYVIQRVLVEAEPEIAFLNRFVDKGLLERLHHVADADFVRVSYADAVDILITSGQAFEYPVSWGCDLQTEHERYLTEQHFKRPVFVTDYPKDIKAFYMKVNPDGKTVAAADLLVPQIGELVGGSQREDDEAVLRERMLACGLEPEGYAWYLELRRYGSVPHAGFGIGFDRLIMYLTGVANIRDVTPYPRTTGSAEF